MTITLHYYADKAALLDNAETNEDRAAIEASYAAYADYLAGEGFEIDADSGQTTYCTTGGEWPEGVKGFWDWYN